MDKCFAACSCDDPESITNADLDRYTDCIENVLSDEKGRRFFKNFMITSKMRDGSRALDFWVRIENLLQYNENNESSSYRRFLRDVDDLIDKADRIEELEFAVVERLINARESQNKEGMVQELKILKLESSKAMRREYGAFKRRFTPAK